MKRRGIPVVLFFHFVNLAFSDVLPSIIWTANNPLFRNLGDEPRKVNEYDLVYIVCPNSKMNLVVQRKENPKLELVENMYKVDEQGYKTCNATGGTKILDCQKPTSIELESTIQVFQPHSGNDGLVFHPGTVYYFIGTASRESSIESSLNNRVGGSCRNGLRVKFYVCKSKNDPKCPHGNKVVNGGWTNWSACVRGVQTRNCTAPAPENGGVMCSGEKSRPCSVHTTMRSTTEVPDTPKPITTATTTTTSPVTSNSPTSVHVSTVPTTKFQEPGTKGKNARAVVDEGVSKNLGVLLGVGAVILLVGVALGFLLGIFCYKSRRQQERMKDNRGSSDMYTDSERPLSILSAGSEVSQKPLVKVQPSDHTFFTWSNKN